MSAMKLELQVPRLEFSQRLKELGVKQESILYWLLPSFNLYHPWRHGWKIVPTNKNINEAKNVCSAFSVAELGMLLPVGAGSWRSHALGMWGAEWQAPDGAVYRSEEEFDTEANVRAYFLIYLIENKLMPL